MFPEQMIFLQRKKVDIILSVQDALSGTLKVKKEWKLK